MTNTATTTAILPTLVSTVVIFLAFTLNLTSTVPAAAPPETPHLKLQLEEVLSIGTFEDDTLYMWAGVAADSTGNIYVTDSMDYSLKKFGSSGQLVKRVGRKGQGPGEFSAPRLLAASGDRLFTTDQGIPGIQMFDTRLKFQARIPFRLPISDIAALSDNRLAVVPLTVGGSGKVMIINPSGEILKEFTYAETQEKISLLNITDVAVAPDGTIYLAYSFKDRIECWSPDGLRIWSRRLLQIKNIPEHKVGRFSVPAEVCFKTIALDSSGRLYVLSGSRTPHPSRDVFVLSQNGDHLATFTLPDPSHCIYIDSRDFLYARANEGVTLKKYRLVINESAD
jgi:DNA-binding beta-propeller fold protein YncE